MSSMTWDNFLSPASFLGPISGCSVLFLFSFYHITTGVNLILGDITRTVCNQDLLCFLEIQLQSPIYLSFRKSSWNISENVMTQSTLFNKTIGEILKTMFAANYLSPIQQVDCVILTEQN